MIKTACQAVLAYSQSGLAEVVLFSVVIWAELAHSTLLMVDAAEFRGRQLERAEVVIDKRLIRGRESQRCLMESYVTQDDLNSSLNDVQLRQTG